MKIIAGKICLGDELTKAQKRNFEVFILKLEQLKNNSWPISGGAISKIETAVEKGDLNSAKREIGSIHSMVLRSSTIDGKVSKAGKKIAREILALSKKAGV